MELSKELARIEEKVNLHQNLFERQPDSQVPEEDSSNKLVDSMFQAAVVTEVKQNEVLKQQVLDTAEHFVSTKMDTTKTKTETENSIAKVKRNEEAVSCYGLPSDKPLPGWALTWVNFGHSIMLGLYIFIASFTLMPILFLAKKINLGIKQTKWAIALAIILYLLVTIIVPVLVGVSNKS